MKAISIWLSSSLLVLTLALAGCSDDDEINPGDKDGGKTDSSNKDGKVTLVDKGIFPDGYKLWPCTTPGQKCNAHDPCAIDPVCGADKLCRPTNLQDCSDNLACTTDTCAGLGVCKNTPTSGTCALSVRVVKGTTCAQVLGGKVKFDAGVTPDTGASDAGAPDTGVPVEKETIFCCFKKGDRNPAENCMECNPEASDDASTGGNSKKWSPANGGTCDDGNLCTMNDYCQYGQCKGTSFLSKCADKYACTAELCDGKGNCLGNPLKSGWCLINSTCYKAGAMHPGGTCFTCDPTKTNSGWTAVTNTCTISGKCYKSGDKDTAGCNQCDPKSSTTSWTPLTGVCSIGGKCYKPGDKHSKGCATCDPKTSQTKWTVSGSYCLISDTCYNPKATNTTKCKECDPTKDKYGWTQISGLCSIGGKCYKPADKHPKGCAECDPTTSQTKWTVKGSYCFMTDICYNPKAKDSTGCNECDPAKQKYGWSAVANTCLVSGKCYTKGAKHSSGCADCIPATNAKAWTVTGNYCLINDTCYNPKAADPTKCGECDPTKNKYYWTVTKASSCLIGGTCYSSGTADPTGCAKCTPAKSTTAWTPSANKCIILGECLAAKKTDTSGCLQCKILTSKSAWTPVGKTKSTVYDFNSGKATGWTIKNTDTKVGWQVVTAKPYEGKYSLYYGDPVKKTYDSGAQNSGTAVSPTITLSGSKKAGLHLRLWKSVELLATYDKINIYINSTLVWDKTKNTLMKAWRKLYFDLSKYAGQTITVKFEFDSIDGVSNAFEGVYIDAMVLYEGC